MNRASTPDDRAGQIEPDLRRRIAAEIQECGAAVVADTAAMTPFTGGDQRLDREYCNRLGNVLVEGLVGAIRAGSLDPRGAAVADLHRVVLERQLPAARLFGFAYLLERSVLDELALSETIGATLEPWPLVAQLVRRGSFDLLAAHTERSQLEPVHASLVDALTTLHTRPLADAVLAKELERAGRFGSCISVILFDVDGLAAINQEHGRGVGDLILERLGILIRQYFRQHDWVARYSDDAILVLLTSTEAEDAARLAERVRATVEERLTVLDHRTERPIPVTLSAAVLNLTVSVGDAVDPERLLADTEAALERAKQQGRNRVVRVDGWSGQPARDGARFGTAGGQAPYSSS
jgi:diguanylate cyclase (GGDEF)-like protein